MPMYKYLCEDCGGITKISRTMTEEKTPDKCIQCGSAKLRRVYSPVGISVKGASSTEAGSSCDSGLCQRY
ncbi:hypothetical protein ES703_117845 [subsurface metagenome]